jgi:hypothetical protein
LVSLSEASIATLLILVVHNELIKLALVEFSFLCFVGFIYNLAPVLPTDGYNFLMDVLQVPDLRPRAFNFIFSGQMFKALRNRPLTREQKAFTVFGLIVAVFMVLLAFNVAFTVLRLLGPTLRTHLPAAIAIAVQVVLITMVIGMFVLSILKEASIGARRAG